MKKKPVYITLKIYNILADRLEKNSKNTKAENHLLGMNKRGVIDTIVPMKTSVKGSCNCMAAVSATELSKSLIGILEKDKTVFGVARVSSHFGKKDYSFGYDNGDDGQMLNVLSVHKLKLLNFIKDLVNVEYRSKNGEKTLRQKVAVK